MDQKKADALQRILATMTGVSTISAKSSDTLPEKIQHALEAKLSQSYEANRQLLKTIMLLATTAHTPTGNKATLEAAAKALDDIIIAQEAANQPQNEQSSENTNKLRK